MLSDLLKDIGLSDKESAMYMALLRNGNQTTSYLARKTGFNRGTAYVVLHQLLAKGLARKSVRRKIQYFSPLHPRHLVGYIHHRRNELQDQEERVRMALPQLIGITNPATFQPKIEYFEGVEGARMVLEDTLTSTDKVLRSYLSIADVSAFIGARAFYDYTMRRIRSGFMLHAIRAREKDRAAFAHDAYSHQYVTSKKQRRIVRHVGDDLAFPVSMYIYDHKIAIISSKEENFAVLIESRELADMQKKLFELLWRSLKR